MLVQKAEVFPVECIVRGYLAGSGWKEYQRAGTVCGIAAAGGARRSPPVSSEPIFTPSTKAEIGDHDENISFDRLIEHRRLRGGGRASPTTRSRSTRRRETMRRSAASSSPTRSSSSASSTARSRSSTRCSPPIRAASGPPTQYEPGHGQPSFDKQFVRDWLEASGWDKTSPPPSLPADVVEATSSKRTSRPTNSSPGRTFQPRGARVRAGGLDGATQSEQRAVPEVHRTRRQHAAARRPRQSRSATRDRPRRSTTSAQEVGLAHRSARRTAYPMTPEYRKWRNVWWGALGASATCAVLYLLVAKQAVAPTAKLGLLVVCYRLPRHRAVRRLAQGPPGAGGRTSRGHRHGEAREDSEADSRRRDQHHGRRGRLGFPKDRHGGREQPEHGALRDLRDLQAGHLRPARRDRRARAAEPRLRGRRRREDRQVHPADGRRPTRDGVARCATSCSPTPSSRTTASRRSRRARPCASASSSSPARNCEQDVVYAAHFLGYEAEYVWHGDTDLAGFDAIVLPGGFSYGDYIRTGAVARFSPVMAEVMRFADAGRPGPRRLQRLPDPHARRTCCPARCCATGVSSSSARR